MRAAINTEFPVPGFTAAARDTGRAGSVKAESSFMDTFSKITQEMKKEAPKKEAAKPQEPGSREDRTPDCRDSKDEIQPAKADTGEGEPLAGEEEEAKGGKTQTMQDGLAILQAQMMLAKQEIPAEEAAAVPENQAGTEQAQTGLEPIIGAGRPDRQELSQDLWTMVQPEQISVAAEQTGKEAGFSHR